MQTGHVVTVCAPGDTPYNITDLYVNKRSTFCGILPNFRLDKMDQEKVHPSQLGGIQSRAYQLTRERPA